MKFVFIGLIVLLIIVLNIILPPGISKLSTGTKIGILEKKYIDTQDTEIGMILMGKSLSNPVLLMLGGGPGIPEYLMEYMYPSGLDEYFTICFLEYRGTGLSYSNHTVSKDMTTEIYLKDVYTATNYLRDRFKQEKIYLMGHSFGTFLGIQAAKNYPELYHSYIAMSQTVDQYESEKLAYKYMINQYKEQGNVNRINELKKYPILSESADYKAYFQSPIRDNAMHELGIGTMKNMDSVISGIFLPSLRCTDYTRMERINIWRGKIDSKDFPVTYDSTVFNVFKEVPKLDIPIYFLSGLHDYTCAYPLQKEYFEFIETPLKRFYTFNNSAHSSLFEEPEAVIRVFIEDILIE